MSKIAVTGSSGRTLQAIGTLGAVLSLAILCASVLLRLTTVFDAHGQPLSTLPGSVEGLTRLVHRVAASGVGLLALAAVVLCWTQRPEAREVRWATASMAVTTIVLAAIGPLTTGYRYPAVTVVNVVGGVVLLMACWWLREALSPARAKRPYRDALLYTTFIVFLVQLGSGAATSALDVQSMRSVALCHAATAMLAIIFLGGTLWERRSHAGIGSIVAVMSGLLAFQVALGVAALLNSPRPLWMAFMHALLSVLMAGGLVSVGVRGRTDSRGESGIA